MTQCVAYCALDKIHSMYGGDIYKGTIQVYFDPGNILLMLIKNKLLTPPLNLML